MPYRILATILALFITAFATELTASEKLRIVTSIKPLTLLARAITPDNTEITTLVPAGASPHTYQLRPSDRKALADADLILWVGPQMETFLERLLTGTELAPRVQALMPPEALQQAHSETHDHHRHDESAHDADDDEHGHHHGGIDPHVWLDPELALIMTKTIRDRLRALDKADADAINSRYDDFKSTLQQRDKQIRTELAGMSDVSLFTYHDAFSRFAAHYGLTITEAFTPTPERSPGARHINVVQEKLRQVSHPCLLTEPQFNRSWWQGLSRETDLTVNTWDPLASSIPESPDGYVQFQQSLANAVLECLPEQAKH